MQSDLPLISVIVPTFNYGSFIQEALESIFHQDYPTDRIEVVVVDDGSTDNTKGIIYNYMGKITYSYQDNIGVAAARNKGISLAKGEIITFLDADDVWYPNRIRRIVEEFRRSSEIGLVYHTVEVINSKGKTIHNYLLNNSKHKKNPKKYLLSDIANGKVFCGGSSFSFTKALLENIYPIPEDIKRGVDFYLTALASCYAHASYIPEILGKYRLHHKNLTFVINKEPFIYAAIHKDFSHTYRKLLSILSHIQSVSGKDLKVLERRYYRSCLLSAVLSDHRLDGIKHLLARLKSIDSFNSFIRALLPSFILLAPKNLYIYAIRCHYFLKKVSRMKILDVIKGMV